MRYLSRYRYMVLALCAVIVLQGCDWIKGQLGMPTSEDIERMKLEISRQESERLAQEAAKAQRIKDSLALVEAAAAAQKPVVEGYYVILGSFKVHKNADALEVMVKKNGYAAEKILMKNGYMMVAIGGFSNFNQAYKELEKIGELDFCPYDLWVYSASQGLHE